MEIDTYITRIQESCNEFIKKNLDIVLTQFENKRVIIDNNFPSFQIGNIAKNTWGVYIFYIKPKKIIQHIKN